MQPLERVYLYHSGSTYHIVFTPLIFFIHLCDISIIFVSMKSKQAVSRLEETIFYKMDKTMKSYRQFAQNNIKANAMDITIDQWLILKTIMDNPDMSQKEIAHQVFKDHASVTRMIELLVKRKYLERSFNDMDRRRYNLELTRDGIQICDSLLPVIYSNREQALRDISDTDIKTLWNIMDKITSNCS